MAKKPFAIRVEESISRRFRAISVVLGKEGALLFNEMVMAREKILSENEKKAYQALLELWEQQEKDKA